MCSSDLLGTAGTLTTKVHQQMVVPGSVTTVNFAYCAADPGILFHPLLTCDQFIVSGVLLVVKIYMFSGFGLHIIINLSWH